VSAFEVGELPGYGELPAELGHARVQAGDHVGDAFVGGGIASSADEEQDQEQDDQRPEPCRDPNQHIRRHRRREASRAERTLVLFSPSLYCFQVGNV
jgi:hypothetical protein